MVEVVRHTTVHSVKGAILFLHALFFQAVGFKAHVAYRCTFRKAVAVGRVQKLIDPACRHFLAQADKQRWWYYAHVLFVVHLEL